MAATILAKGTETKFTGSPVASPITYTGLAVGTDANSYVVIAFSFDTSTGVITGVSATLGGQTMTAIGQYAGTDNSFSCLFGVIPSGANQGTSPNIVISWTLASGNLAHVFVSGVSYGGVDQTTPFNNVVNATVTTQHTVNVTSAVGNQVIGAMFSYVNANTIVPNSLYNDTTGQFTNGEAAYGDGAATVAVGTDVNCGITACNIVAAAAAGAAVTHFLSQMGVGR
jgi:hypothetical protein